MKQIKLLLPALLLAALLPGCATTPEENAARVQSLCYAAASLGSQAALVQNPAYRPALELAYTNLNSLVERKVITGNLLRDVIATLPTKELKSDNARITIEGATILFDTLAGTKLNIEAQPLVLAAATGIRDGLKATLGH
jgi:hypothetical protein